jgi:hypothetical protein
MLTIFLCGFGISRTLMLELSFPALKFEFCMYGLEKSKKSTFWREGWYSMNTFCCWFDEIRTLLRTLVQSHDPWYTTSDDQCVCHLTSYYIFPPSPPQATIGSDVRLGDVNGWFINFVSTVHCAR